MFRMFERDGSSGSFGGRTDASFKMRFGISSDTSSLNNAVYEGYTLGEHRALYLPHARRFRTLATDTRNARSRGAPQSVLRKSVVETELWLRCFNNMIFNTKGTTEEM